MEWLVEFAYAAPDAIDVTALRERLSGEGVRGFIGVPMGKITGAEVVSLQRELPGRYSRRPRPTIGRPP